MIEYLVGATAALAVLCTVGGYAVLQQRRRFDARLQTYLAGTFDLLVEQSAVPIQPRPARKLIGINQLQLVQAGMTMPARNFLIVQIVLAFGLAAVAWVFGQSLGIWLLGAFAAAFAAALFLPHLFVLFKRRRRLAKFESQFSNALDALANSAEVGLSISQSMETISRDMPAPLGAEFSQILREMGMGVSLTEALNGLADRVPSQDVEIFVAALAIQHRTGGGLSPVLRKIADTVRQRINMRAEINALTAQQRYSAYLIALLPVILFAIMGFISPEYFAMLLQPGLMRIILLGAPVGIVVGLLFMLRIADVEV